MKGDFHGWSGMRTQTFLAHSTFFGTQDRHGLVLQKRRNIAASFCLTKVSLRL
jgi:hypothetical protein